MFNNKTSRRNFLLASTAAALGSVALKASAATQPVDTVTRTYTFDKGSAGLLPCFCDYLLDTDNLEMLAEVRPLPGEVQVPSHLPRSAYYLQSRNRADDMFMYLKGLLSSADGLIPNQDYRLEFDIRFASNATNCIGVGGSEDSVWLKAGGSTFEPVPQLYPNNYLGINVSKGHQEEGGPNLGLVGSIWNGAGLRRGAPVHYAP
jgi:hypothetical protein